MGKHSKTPEDMYLTSNFRYYTKYGEGIGNLVGGHMAQVYTPENRARIQVGLEKILDGLADLQQNESSNEPLTTHQEGEQ